VPSALVTGATGFVGPFLIRYLLEAGYEVVGGIHSSWIELPERCGLVSMDVSDSDAVRSIVAAVEPDEVYHLAGLTRPAGGGIEEFYEVNFKGTLNLLEAIRGVASGTRVLLVGSAYAYGKSDQPIAETKPLEPVNHYGVSKAAADMLGRTYALQGVHVVNVRPFNHSGPGQNPDFLLPTLAEQFTQIMASENTSSVKLGNLGSVRDLCDVRDVVRAYHLALSKGRPGEAYNVGSGRGVSVQDLFELVRQEAGIDVQLTVEPARVRAQDIPYLVADVTKTHKELGWETEIPLAKTIHDMLRASSLNGR
jgi:GDP-4-dehydro-6-deoxy-D-mannose reductase